MTSLRTNNHIMGFFALLLLITVVAISVDRLRESQDVRKEASAVCPQQLPICTDGTQGTYNDQCQPVCPPSASAPMVAMRMTSSGPFYLYNFYDYTVEPPVLDSINYEVMVSLPRSSETIDLTFSIPATAELDDIGFTANMGITALKTKDVVVADNREITLSFSGIAAKWSAANTPISLGKFRARPTTLGPFSIALPAEKNPFVTISEGSELQTAEILPSLEVTAVGLEPGSGFIYRITFSAKNINPNQEVYLGKITFTLKRGGEITILETTGTGHLDPGNATLVQGNFDNLLQAGDEIIVSFKPSDTVINELPEAGTLKITQALLDQLHAQMFYDLSISGAIAPNQDPSTPFSYELILSNSTTEANTPVVAKNVLLDITSSQPNVTLSSTTHASKCTNTDKPSSLALRCKFAEVGVITPISITVSGANPGTIIFNNTLIVQDNPNQESNLANNSLVLTSVINQPTQSPFRTADIWPIGNPDRKVDMSDYAELARHFNQRGSAGWISADIQPDGWIDLGDYGILVNQFAPTGY